MCGMKVSNDMDKEQKTQPTTIIPPTLLAKYIYILFYMAMIRLRANKQPAKENRLGFLRTCNF